MPELQPGTMLRIHLTDDDRLASDDRNRGKPLYELVVDRCRELGVAGTTVFRGLEGYGESAEILRPHLLTHDQPIVVTIIETPEKAAWLLPELQKMLPGVLIAVSEVQMLRIDRT